MLVKAALKQTREQVGRILKNKIMLPRNLRRRAVGRLEMLQARNLPGSFKLQKTRLMAVDYSSNVELNLVAGDHTLSLSQIGPGYAILREAVSMDPCDAEIVVSVDGDDRRIPVRLVDGAVPFDTNVRVMRKL